MVGQEKLLKYLSSFNLDTFPKASILLGERGSGKKLICKYIKTFLQIPMESIGENLNLEYLNELQQRVEPHLYVVDIMQLTEKQQNILLKFIEEPLKNSYIIITGENKNYILPTVYNRCMLFELERYTKQELTQFALGKSGTELEILLDVFHTPGSIQEAARYDILALKDLCTKMVNKISAAAYPNTLTITNKFNFKDEFDKYDVSMLFKMFTHCLCQEYMIHTQPMYMNMYKLTMQYKKHMYMKTFNKKLLVENFLTNLWLTARGVTNGC